MTTHQSIEHMKFLSQCWPKASHTLPLLRNADLIYYTSAASHDVPFHIFDTLGFRNVYVYQHIESSYQLGAKRAMVDAFYFGKQWFQGYDWIIRLNPDVLIRNDEWLMQQMHNTSAQAIAVYFEGVDYCKVTEGVPNCIHSDFVAFRPSLLQLPQISGEVLRELMNDDLVPAEHHMNYMLLPLLTNKSVSFIPNVVVKPLEARILGKHSPVIHEHAVLNSCPDYFNATDGE
jgi:hypothetical protein